MTAQEQAFSELVAEGLRDMGLPAIARDDSEKRSLPCVSVAATRGGNDPLGSNCYEYTLEITLRTKSEADMEIHGATIGAVSRNDLQSMIQRDNQFTVFGIRMDGMKSDNGQHSRSTSISAAVWATDNRSN